MRKQNKNSKPSPYYVPSSIQRLFTYTIVGLYLVQTLFLGFSTVSQSLEGSDYRPQFGYFFSYNIVPVLIFMIAHWLNPRQLSRLSKAFESLLISITALIGWSVARMFFPMILFGLIGFDSIVMLSYITPFIFLALFFVLLLLIRKRGVWS